MTERTDKPDYHIECFWLSFKKSIDNFYTSIGSKFLSRNVSRWSDKLNKLQREHTYELIEIHIRDYMVCYGLDVIRSGDSYHLSILGTNIKRWDKISKQYILESHPESGENATINENHNKYKKSMNCDCDNNNSYNSRKLFQCCLEICIHSAKHGIPFAKFMEDIELIVLQHNISPLLDMAEELHKSFIYELLILHSKPLLLKGLIDRYGEDMFNKIDLRTARGTTIAKTMWK
jgi:hypothetical protein